MERGGQRAITQILGARFHGRVGVEPGPMPRFRGLFEALAEDILLVRIVEREKAPADHPHHLVGGQRDEFRGWVSLRLELSRGLRPGWSVRSEEHTSELQSRRDLVCRLL